VQVNGKMRGTVQVDKQISQQDALSKALAELESVQKQIDGKAIRKVIFVPGKIMNIIVSK
jgi:leucyl-tRNA synthetase